MEVQSLRDVLMRGIVAADARVRRPGVLMGCISVPCYYRVVSVVEKNCLFGRLAREHVSVCSFAGKRGAVKTCFQRNVRGPDMEAG